MTALSARPSPSVASLLLSIGTVSSAFASLFGPAAGDKGEHAKPRPRRARTVAFCASASFEADRVCRTADPSPAMATKPRRWYCEWVLRPKPPTPAAADGMSNEAGCCCCCGRPKGESGERRVVGAGGGGLRVRFRFFSRDSSASTSPSTSPIIAALAVPLLPISRRWSCVSATAPAATAPPPPPIAASPPK